jgi:hypothetical protein
MNKFFFILLIILFGINLQAQTDFTHGLQLDKKYTPSCMISYELFAIEKDNELYGIDTNGLIVQCLSCEFTIIQFLDSLYCVIAIEKGEVTEYGICETSEIEKRINAYQDKKSAYKAVEEYIDEKEKIEKPKNDKRVERKLKKQKKDLKSIKDPNIFYKQ